MPSCPHEYSPTHDGCQCSQGQAPPSRIEQVSPSDSTSESGDVERGALACANAPLYGILASVCERALRRHRARPGVADFQHATAYSADGAHSRMFALTAPGDGSG